MQSSSGIGRSRLSGSWDMRRAVCLLVGSACLALSACASLGTNAGDVRSAMLGMQERELLGCLGPPTDYAFASERRLFVYRLDLSRRAFERVRQGSLAEPLFCNAAFQIDRGRISDVAVVGVDTLGLNADARCTVVVGECLADLALATGRRSERTLAPRPGPALPPR